MSGGTSTDSDSAPSVLGTSSSTSAVPTKRKSRLPWYFVIVIIVVILALAGAGLKFFILKPKAASAPTSTTAATPKAAAPSAPAATTMVAVTRPANSDDPDMAPCQLDVLHFQGSDTLIGSKGGTEVTVKIVGVETPGYGTLVPEMERQASAIVRGAVKVEPFSVEHGLNKMTAKVILADGRNAAEAIVGAGWATAGSDASETIKRLAKEAETSKRGIYAEVYQHPPWTNF